MNILPKKSWHVRTKKNIERVRRDEAEAATKEKELQKRAKIAELEASIDVLRKRKREDSPPVAEQNEEIVEERVQVNVDIVNPSGSSGAGHLNLFRDVELAEGKLHGGNAEADADRKKEAEDWEKKVGILQYLGQSANSNETISTRFYQKLERTVDGRETTLKQEREKDAQDPLKAIHKYLITKKGECSRSPLPEPSRQEADLRRIEFHPEGTSGVKKSSSKKRKTSISSSSSDDEYSRRERKRKKGKKSKRRRTPSSESDPESEEERRHRKRTNMAILRKKRIEREEQECKRTEEFLKTLAAKSREGRGSSQQDGAVSASAVSTAAHDRQADAEQPDDSQQLERNRRYNSQYNPHLARY